jgi:hypothetical protein
MNVDTMRQIILNQLGNPADVDRELQSFRRSAKVLSSHHPRLIDRYQKKWVAIYNGRTRAQGRTLQSALRQIDRKGLPRAHVIVRYIDKNQRTMIL